MSTFSIAQMAEAFGALPETCREILHFGGYSPCDHGFDGCSPVYDVAAASYLAEKLPERTAQESLAELRAGANELRAYHKAMLVPVPAEVRAELCD